MRFVYVALIVAFNAFVLLFKSQNFETATISLVSATRAA
jgi:hypothetical protein